MQRHESLKFIQNSQENEPNLITSLERPDDEEEFYTASVNFLNERLQEKCRNRSSRQKASQSCCNLSTDSCIVPELRKTQSKVKFGFDVPDEPEILLTMNKVLPFPKPKSTKKSFFTRLTNTFRKYRRCFNLNIDTEPEESETLKNYSNFKFPRCERLSNCTDSPRLHNITEETSRGSLKELSDLVKGNSEGDCHVTAK
ncbi:unnamed protein product [Parnassius apollo]|uniref:(apollo) hypothetical protein n=1 Tax=Parnassius apollo TaxID=110799 RepID=A0A8S3X463_PARAO|nr:unnamed protein product [Parnassius apollo]